MTDDTQRQATPRDDIPRHVATSGATYSLSPEAVVDRLARAGVPRDLRTVQRWCKRGALDCRRDDIAGYFISDLSLLRKITELQQLMELQARRDTTRHDAADDDVASPDNGSAAATTACDTPRQSTTGDDAALTKKQETSTTTDLDMSRHVAMSDATRSEAHVKTGDASFDIFAHPYVQKLEREVEDYKINLDTQQRRTEQLLVDARADFVALAKSSQVAQSETLANFFLKARQLLSGSAPATEPDTKISVD